jgi:hypothetical protein
MEIRRRINMGDPMTGYQGGGGGLKAVRSGAMEYMRCCIHDFETRGGQGGTRTIIQGDLGTGKTTLNNQSVMKFGYLKKVSKRDFLEGTPDKLYPETIISRGRKKDYWNLFMPENFRKSFGKDYPVRQLKVFIHKDDDIVFYEQQDNEEESVKILQPEIYKYTDIADLYQNIVIGGINIVYPPNDYMLSDLLKKRINDLMMKSKEGRKFLQENQSISVPSVAFWYDVFYFFISDVEEIKETIPGLKIIKSVVFVFDEAHQIFPSGASKPLWYLVDNFAEDEIIETRRINVSIWADVHDYRFVYWKILGRFNFFIFLRGARSMVKQRLSKIQQSLIDQLPIGTFLIEEKSVGFGKVDFDRIKNPPQSLTAKGMK